MKKKSANAYLFVIFFVSFALFTYWYSRSPTVDSAQTITDRRFSDEKLGTAAKASNGTIITKSKNRHERITKSPLMKPDDQPIVELIGGGGDLNEKSLESRGLGKSQIDGVKEVFIEISVSLSRHFMDNCEEVLTDDGSYFYVLEGDPEFSLVLQGEMRTRLGKVIGSGSSGSKLADQIVKELKGRALLNFGADDMIAAAFRDVNKEGTGWEDGMRINGLMPGMIDHYRENGWPNGDDIHTSNGKAIFYPIENPH